MATIPFQEEINPEKPHKAEFLKREEAISDKGLIEFGLIGSKCVICGSVVESDVCIRTFSIKK